MKKISYLYLELLALFVAVPVAIYHYGFVLSPVVVLFLLLGYMYYASQSQKRGGMERILSLNGFSRRSAAWVLKRFFFSAGLLFLLILLYDPRLLFQWLIEKPFLWFVIVIFYPLFSVLPQELLFRTFFFIRYQRIFGKKKSMVLASAVIFAFAHIVFHNPVAIALSFVGGIFFASTYSRTRSLKLVVLEHSLYGLMIFTIGMGGFFYHADVHLH